MAYASFAEYKEAVLAASDLIVVAREYGFVLGPDGGVTHCRFHADSTPSLSFRRATQLFHCFGAGCGISGDVIRLVERLDGLAFRQALDKLALRAGMAPFRASAEELNAIEVERQVGDLIEFAAEHYHARLDAESRAYWAGRGLPPEMLDPYRIGTADGSLVAAVTQRFGPTYLPVLIHAGLADRAHGREIARDLFMRRLVIPLTARGRAVFLTARALDPDMQPKYFHQRGREAPLFNEDAVTGGTVFVTEGPFDALALLAWGYPAVALQGGARASALGKLNRCKRVYAVLDNDAAGLRATFELARALGDTLRVVALPPGMDPADVYRTQPRATFEAAVAAARDPISFAACLIPRPCPPDQVTAALAPIYTMLATYPESSSAVYLEQVVAPRLGLTSKAGLAALHADLQTVRTGATTTCPFCRATLIRPPGLRR